MKDADKGLVAQAQLMRSIAENWAAHLELAALNARMSRAKFLALVKEGFTEEQALFLTK